MFSLSEERLKLFPRRVKRRKGFKGQFASQ
jgi:hypothetical protein